MLPAPRLDRFFPILSMAGYFSVFAFGPAPVAAAAASSEVGGAKSGSASPGGAAVAVPKSGGAKPNGAKKGGAKAAPKAGGFDVKQPSTWTLSAKLAPRSPEREALVREWTAPAADAGEAALTREEAEALLDDPRAQLVYGEKTASIVAPSMLTRQRAGHVNLLDIFLKPERIEAGAQFARSYAPQLERAELRHGVDREVVVSILMWESRLGTITGDYFAFNSFVSQAFFIDEANTLALSTKAERALLVPERQAKRVETIRNRARKNLRALVRGGKARGMDPLAIKGSWAGALGFPQFMPASLRWAEDGDGDGKIDLFTFDDSIASIARYLSEHGFKGSREKAVWAYNHEDAYVSGVLAFADALSKRLAEPEMPEAAAPDAGEGGEAPQPAQ